MDASKNAGAPRKIARLGGAPSSSQHWGRRLASVVHLIAIVLSEYRRAVAAQRSYDDLRRYAPTLARFAATDVPRHLFRELYGEFGSEADVVAVSGCRPFFS